MTFTEVVVASVVLSLSARLGLQSWTATARAADRTATQTALTVQLDQQVLASQRLLAASSGSDLLLKGSTCRLDSAAIQQLLDAELPPTAGLERELVMATNLQGLWLVWHDGLENEPQPWQRRLLLTPAGLGLCGEHG